MNSLAMATAKTALTISSRKKITSRKSTRARGWMISPARVPIDRPLWRTEAQSVPKSWTPAMKTVPSKTQISAGSHPQITAMAGPMMGAAPATEVKWCPHSTYRLVGR